MTDVIKKIQQGIDASRMRTRDLQRKLAALPDDSGPEVRVLYEQQLAKEKKYQEQMALAMVEPPQKKKSSAFRVLLVIVLLLLLVYLLLLR